MGFGDNVRDANNRDNKIPSVVNNKIVLFNAVDCSLYNNANGIDCHRFICIKSGAGSRTTRAIVGADIRMECVSNHASFKPNTGAVMPQTE